jgi:hypothetical protein
LDFHTWGRIVTSQLVDLVNITKEDEVLDASSGITDPDYPLPFPDFAERAQNLTRALTDGRLRAVQAVARAVDRGP